MSGLVICGAAGFRLRFFFWALESTRRNPVTRKTARAPIANLCRELFTVIKPPAMRMLSRHAEMPFYSNAAEPNRFRRQSSTGLYLKTNGHRSYRLGQRI